MYLNIWLRYPIQYVPHLLTPRLLRQLAMQNRGCAVVNRGPPALRLMRHAARQLHFDTASSEGTIFSLGGQTRRVGGWTRFGKLTLTLTSY